MQIFLIIIVMEQYHQYKISHYMITNKLLINNIILINCQNKNYKQEIVNNKF